MRFMAGYAANVFQKDDYTGSSFHDGPSPVVLQSNQDIQPGLCTATVEHFRQY